MTFDLASDIGETSSTKEYSILDTGNVIYFSKMSELSPHMENFHTNTPSCFEWFHILKVNVQSMAQMIENSDPPDDVFRAMVKNAAISQDDLINELCCDEVLSQDYAELLRHDIEGQLKDDQGP